MDGAIKLSAILHQDEKLHPSLAHVHILAEIGRGPTAVLEACVLGIGEEKAIALEDAAQYWVNFAAPPIFSLLHAKPVMGAEHFEGHEKWGVTGRHGFVGPVAVRSKGKKINLDVLAESPLFSGASEVASEGLVHFAKSILEVVDGSRWRRSLEIDGHGTSLIEDDVKPGIKATPEIITCVRYAVYFPTPFQRTDDFSIDEIIRKFVAAFNADRGKMSLEDGISFLFEQGFKEEVVHKIGSFVPLAFTRYILRSLGVTFSNTYMEITSEGIARDGLKLCDEPIFQRAMVLAEFLIRSPQYQVGMKFLSMTSSEFRAINQSMTNGSKPQDLVLSPPVIIDPDAAPDAMNKAIAEITAKLKSIKPESSKKKYWWQFWK
jgi:hypothetical protein